MVQILMSTYNGSRYIKEQLESIIAQTYSDWELLIRDDGSTDDTVKILKEYAEKNGNIKYYRGINKGACNSFFDLLAHVDKNAKFVAFCDQDDYWMPDKIDRGVKKIEEHTKNKGDIPILYCSKTTIVNEKLEKIGNIKTGTIVPGFGNAILENINTGCTSILNKQLIGCLTENKFPKYAVMHDWWIYLVASCFGEVIYDQKSRILYRQHSSNVIGVNVNFFKKMIRRMRNYKRSRNLLSIQAKEFLKIYKINHKNKDLLCRFIRSKRCFKDRLRLFLGNDLYRQSGFDHFIFKLLILLGNM